MYFLKSMNKDDIAANVLSGGAIALAFANIESVLTILVLSTALVYNVYKIIKLRQRGESGDT